MKVIRVHITGWVTSFRNPLFISGFQPTLALPPLSAIYGLLTAAKGEWVTPHDAAVGYVFQSHGKAVDLETVYEFEKTLGPRARINRQQHRGNSARISYSMLATSNINRREFLLDPQLYLYTPEMWLRKAFERPEYPLLMGRSSDLATVTAIEEIELEHVSETTYQNTLIPFPHPQIHGQVQALPTHFSAEIPRKPLGMRAYCLVTEKIYYHGDALQDPEKKWGVYLHERIRGDFHVPDERGPRIRKAVNRDFEIPNVDGEQMQLPGL